MHPGDLEALEKDLEAGGGGVLDRSSWLMLVGPFGRVTMTGIEPTGQDFVNIRQFWIGFSQGSDLVPYYFSDNSWLETDLAPIR